MPLPSMPTKLADRVTLSVTPAQKVKQPAPKAAKTPSKAPPKPPQEPPKRKLTGTNRLTPLSKAASLSGIPKIFVLDTNVLLHDPTSLFRFEEHDLFIPMKTLEELDAHKSGLSDTARNARQVSRLLDRLIADVDSTIILSEGIALDKLGNIEAKGRLYLEAATDQLLAPQDAIADNIILNAVTTLSKEKPDRLVVLVSKDINMRLKARALGLSAEDYFNDQVLDDQDLLYTGTLKLENDFWDQATELTTKNENDHHSYSQTVYTFGGSAVPDLFVNQFVYLEATENFPPFYARVVATNGTKASIKTLHDYTEGKDNVWGIHARNSEQNFALNLLMDPEVDFVTLAGQAGTGKTLLALAAGLSQVFESQRFDEIIVTRPTIPIGEDIGFLPGTEEEKMSPWMGALDDNLDVLTSGNKDAGSWERQTTRDLIESRISIKSMNFMRGRTFIRKFVIIDEAQNLTPKQMKTLITRAGPGTKIVCMGNLAQIDTPYLTEGSSGLTYVVDRFKGWRHSGHILLARGERSRLADYAGEML